MKEWIFIVVLLIALWVMALMLKDQVKVIGNLNVKITALEDFLDIRFIDGETITEKTAPHYDKNERLIIKNWYIHGVGVGHMVSSINCHGDDCAKDNQ